MTESTAEKLLAARDDRKKSEEVAIERVEEYKAALNKIANTPDGYLVLRAIMRYCGIFAVKPTRDGMGLVSDKALHDFYIMMIRSHLNQQNRQTLEN